MANRPQYLIPKRAAEPSPTARTCRLVFNGPAGNWPASLTLTADHEPRPTLDVSQIEGVRVRVSGQPEEPPSVVLYIEGGLIIGAESDAPCTVYVIDVAEDVDDTHPRLVPVPDYCARRRDGRAHITTYAPDLQAEHLANVAKWAAQADKQAEQAPE